MMITHIAPLCDIETMSVDISVTEYNGTHVTIQVNSETETIKVDGVEAFFTGKSDTFWLKTDGEYLYRGDQYVEIPEHRPRGKLYDTCFAIDKIHLTELTNEKRKWENIVSPSSGNVKNQKNSAPGKVIWERDEPLKTED